MKDERKKSWTANDFRLLKRFLTYARPYRRPLVTVYVLYFLNSVLNLFPAASLAYYFDVIISGKTVTFFSWTADFSSKLQPVSQKVTWSIIYFIIVVFLIIAANTIGVIMWRLGTRVSQRVMLDIKRRIHHHLHRLSISYFEGERTGTIMTRTVGDVEQMEQMLRDSFVLLYAFTHLVTVPIIMIAMSPALFLAVLVPVPVIFYCMQQIRTKLRPLYHAMREQQAQIGATIQENIAGMREIKAFKREPVARRDYTRTNLNYIRLVHKSMRVFSLNHQVLYGTRDVAILLIAVGGGMMVILGWGNVTLGIVIAYLPLINRFFDPIGQMVGFYDTIQRGLASADRVFDFLDIVPEVKDRPGAKWLALTEGRVAFEDVSFSYREGVPVIKDISFQIEPAQTVAVVGATGAGKSTLVSLLLRFYEPGHGRILIDGHDIMDLKLSALGHAIGVVFQETFLFHGTVAENIAFSRPGASREEIVAAARFANIDDFIESLPDQYDTPVGERGVKLSGGQRQRVAIARMVIKDPSIIVLDEATSSVDTETEQAIQASFDRLMEGRTAFVIAHRLSTIRNADIILVLHHGRLVEQGSHEQLLAKQGRYTRLVESARF